MIKVMVPSMPTADDLLPYLRRIDAARVYVNNGPLVQELQARLEQMTGAHVALVSNGTVALELALKALNIDDSHDDDGDAYRSYVSVPAITFSASGLSIIANRLTPILCDVNLSTCQMAPEHVAESVSNTDTRKYYREMECAMPVATFGSPVDVKQWEGYPVPVIIDAAGAFPQQEVSKDPNIATCFSLHATKFVGCGEGGFVASANKELIERIRSLAAFGENGTNAKMSEYHAAVALASLDRLPHKMERTQRIADWYADYFGDMPDCQTNVYGPCSTILNILLPIPAAEVIPKMFAAGIETKQWYRPYLDERSEFAVPRGTFPVTDHLREHLLGLPFHNFMTEADVMHVCSTLKGALR